MDATAPPLKPVDLHLLLALADRPLHGYALSRRIEEESDGRVRLMPGNLYAVLRRLVRDGLVEETDERPREDSEDERRRYFALTTAGTARLVDEGRRLARTAELLHARVFDRPASDGEVTP